MIKLNSYEAKSWERCDSCLKEDVQVHLAIGAIKSDVRISRLCSQCVYDLSHMLNSYYLDKDDNIIGQVIP